MSTTSCPPSSTFLSKAHVASLADEVTACRTHPSTAGAPNSLCPRETARTNIHPELPLGQGLPPTLPAHDPRTWDCHLVPTLQMKSCGTQHPCQRRAKRGRGIFRFQFWPSQRPPLCPGTSGRLTPAVRMGHPRPWALRDASQHSLLQPGHLLRARAERHTVGQVLAVHRFENKKCIFTSRRSA